MSIINAIGPLSDGPQVGETVIAGIPDSTVYAVKVRITGAPQVVTVSALTKTAGTYTVYWGDGGVETASTSADATISGTWGTVATNPTTTSHTYYANGDYYISLKSSTGYLWCNIGEDSRTPFTSTANPLSEGFTDSTVIDVSQWGKQKFYRTNSMFRDNGQLNSITAQDTFDLTECVSMDLMFANAAAFNVNIANWKVGNVSSMNSMFHQAFAFNQDLTAWCVTKITSLPLNKVGVASFSTDSPLPSSKYPKWGTCPTGEVYVPPTMTVTATAASYTFTAGTSVPTTSTVTVSGGTAPFSYSISPDLAVTIPGLTFNGSTGQMTGTPTTAINSVPVFTVSVTDSSAVKQTKTDGFSISVAQAATVTLTATSFVFDDKYSITPTQIAKSTGLIAPITWAMTNPVPGLSINSTGYLTGTPTIAGTYTFNVRATDSSIPPKVVTSAGQATVKINSATALSFSGWTTPQNFIQGITVGTTTIGTISGGKPPYSATVSPNIGGITFGVNGTFLNMTGVPTASSPVTTYTATISDTVTSIISTFQIQITGRTTVSLFDGATSYKLYQKQTINKYPVLTNGTAIANGWLYVGLPSGIQFDKNTGELFGSSSAVGSYTITVHVNCSNGQTATDTATLVIEAGDISNSIFEDYNKVKLWTNQQFYNIKVVDASGTITGWTIDKPLPDGVNITYSNTGAILSGKPTATSPKTDYTVSAFTGYQVKSVTFSIVVNENLSAVTNPSLNTTWYEGITVSPQQTLIVSGGTPPYKFSAQPTFYGLDFDTTTGIISGNPSRSPTRSDWSGYFQVTDSSVGQTSATIPISSTYVRATISPQPVANAVVPFISLIKGNQMTQRIPVVASLGKSPITYSISPNIELNVPGLTYNTSTAYISGTPTVDSANVVYTVTATDSVNRTSSANFVLNIGSAITLSYSNFASVLQSQTAGTSRTITPTLTGGVPPYRWSVTPQLSTGSTIDSNGVITINQQTPIDTTYQVLVKDSADRPATANVRVKVNSVAIITMPDIVADINKQFTAIPTITGGTAPFTFTIEETQLPSWCVFDPVTGRITGSTSVRFPSSGGPQTFKIAATDASGVKVTDTFQLSVFEGISISGITQNIGATIRVPINIPAVSITGGSGTYTLAVTGTNQLPTWAKLASNGAITGTPSVVQPTTEYTITVTDTQTRSASYKFTLSCATSLNIYRTEKNIGAGGGTFLYTVGQDFQTLNKQYSSATNTFLTSVMIPVNSGTAWSYPTDKWNLNYATTVPAVSGLPPYTFTVSPDLPNGLVMDPNTSIISGTPTVNSATTNYKVIATDQGGRTASVDISLVNPLSLTTTNVIIPAGTNPKWNLSPVPTGGRTPYKWKFGSGKTGYVNQPADTPTGLSLDVATGQVTGEYSGTINFSIADTSTNNTSHIYVDKTVNVGLALSNSVTTDLIYTVGSPSGSSKILSFTGGIAPYTVLLTPSNRVTSLTMTGTTGSVSITYDASQASLITRYTISVSCAIGQFSKNVYIGSKVVATSSNPSGFQFIKNSTVAATTVVNVTGGNGLYKYTASGLPPNLGINETTGTISGKPIVSGVYSPVITVTSPVNGNLPAGGQASVTIRITIP